MKSITDIIDELPPVQNRDEKNYCPDFPVDGQSIDNGNFVTIQQLKSFQNKNVFVGCLEGNNPFVRIGNLNFISDEMIKVGEKNVPVSIIKYIYSI